MRFFVVAISGLVGVAFAAACGSSASSGGAGGQGGGAGATDCSAWCASVLPADCSGDQSMSCASDCALAGFACPAEAKSYFACSQGKPYRCDESTSDTSCSMQDKALAKCMGMKLTTSSSVSSSMSASSASASSGGGLPCVYSCNDALSNGGEPCDSSANSTIDAYKAVASCAMSFCPDECADFMSGPLPDPCFFCLMNNCDKSLSTCFSN